MNNETAYEQAKRGNWQALLQTLAASPHLGRRLSRYQKASSGWSALHQAAYFGHEQACRALIRLGASTIATTTNGQASAQTAFSAGRFVKVVERRQTH